MIRRVVGIVAIAIWSVTATAAVTPTMGADTYAFSDCEKSSGSTWWSYDVEGYTNIGGNPGPIYEVGVSTEWEFGCGGDTGCLDDGYDEDVRYGNYTARAYGANNGYHGSSVGHIYGQAYSYHWVDGESFSDDGNTGGGFGSECGGS